MTILALDPADSLSVFVSGHAAAQGSKRHVGNGRMIESSKKLPGWRESVRAALIDGKGQPRARFEGAVHVDLEFIMPRPVSTPKKRTPPAIRKPDIDKLERGILDSVTSAGVWRDDAQVTSVSKIKRIAEIGETPGCRISFRGL